MVSSCSPVLITCPRVSFLLSSHKQTHRISPLVHSATHPCVAVSICNGNLDIFSAQINYNLLFLQLKRQPAAAAGTAQNFIRISFVAEWWSVHCVFAAHLRFFFLCLSLPFALRSSRRLRAATIISFVSTARVFNGFCTTLLTGVCSGSTTGQINHCSLT